MIQTRFSESIFSKLIEILIKSHRWLPVLIAAFPIVSWCQMQNDELESIKQAFWTINNDTALQRVTLQGDKFLGESVDGGGELVGYFKGDSIVKITEDVGLSFGVMKIEYYFKGGYLIFVYEKEKDFPYDDSTASFDYTRLSLVFEGKYYFHNDSLIKKIVKGKRSSNISGMSQNPSQFIANAGKLVHLLKASKNGL